jgi:hypothetical protein
VSWWSCLRARYLWKTSGSTESSKKSTRHIQGTRLGL